jgi:hypothetical protein
MSCVTFPRPMKRGPKVKRGPVADVLPFPARLSGSALEARWAWLFDHAKRWGQETTEGTYTELEDWRATVDIHGRLTAQMLGRDFNEASMRANVEEWEGQIETRRKMKRWLNRMSALGLQFHSAEAALVFLYEQRGASANFATAADTKEEKLLRLLRARISAANRRSEAHGEEGAASDAPTDDGPRAA